ncbi:MAG: CoA transferase [Alphaproteobacteria bacterium]|nr:CoA transferase [Alphaproteobacteria bacterium]MDE2011411.1 CoA transferase [Alphaproteobacteria bacterium]MDE2071802.1 CoA transferase [Alphaproteobacteria bacterium]MDE2350408.1 CoA transferase [Alphaproteobacteria bacterium]
MGALSHIRVLDLSRVLAGPFATQILGDLGAEIIKVEKPGEGDETRHFGPPFLKTDDGRKGDAVYFLSANRNKKSVTIDFSRPEGAALVRRLARRAHVVVENFKTGALARYGLDYQRLAAENPALIYCSLTGFGHDGPYKDKAGYDYLIQGMAGLMSVTGQPDGAPGAEPMKVGVAVSDVFTGLYATIAIQAALIHQSRTGEGQQIDMALFDCQAAAMVNQAMNYLAGGMVPGRLGNAHPNIVPYQVFRAADGHLILAVANDGQFRRFCAGAGLDGLATDPRFATNGGRVEHREALVAQLKPVFAARGTADWIGLLEAANVPCGPINRIDQVFGDPHAVARGLKISLEHRAAGSVDLVASPLRLAKTPPEYRHAPPLLGEHTDEILHEILGLQQAEIAKLRADGVL